MNKKIILIILVIIGIIFAIISGNSQTNTNTIKVGAVLSLTGSATVDGTNIKLGLELAREDLEKSGVHVKISYEDDATDAKQTVSALRKSIALDKPDVIMGPTWSPFIDAGQPIIEEAKIAAYAPANTSETHSFDSNYMFFGALRNEIKEGPTTEWLKEHSLKRAVILVDKTGWGESHVAPFEKAVKNAGGVVVFVERVPPGTEAESFPTILAKAYAEKADVVLWTGYDSGAIALLKKIQDSKKPMYALMASTATRGLVNNGILKLSDTDQFYDIAPTVSEEFSTKFKEKYGEAPGAYADNAYDGLMLIAEAMNKKDSNESLASYMHNKTNYRGYSAQYKFTKKGDINGGSWIVKKL